MPARTERGVRALEEILGFEDFLADGAADRDRSRGTRTPEMLDGLLPFAVAFGLEKRWVKAFEGIALQPSRWYAGPQGPAYRIYDYPSNINRMTRHMGSALSSSPRSSSGSSGRGGSSGGGFGGGGGGGF